MAKAPVILAGGGCRRSEGALRACAETFGAPVIQTTNARGLMHGHPLTVPASPSLEPVRDLLRQADAVLVAGSELGPTDIDMYGRGGWPELARMARIDICPAQLARHAAAVVVQGDVRDVLPRIVRRSAPAPDGPARAAATRAAARAALSEAMRDDIRMLEALRAARPGAIVVGDSTHAVYAGNLFYDHDRPGGWFNAATGYGALGYATGAAVGAALAAPGVPVLCLIGDGGLMFAPGEVMTAVEEGLDISYVVLNNRGFGEIAEAMRAAGAEPFGCKPEPPDLKSFSKACRLHFRRCTKLDVGAELATMHGPAMIEVTLPPVK